MIDGVAHRSLNRSIIHVCLALMTVTYIWADIQENKVDKDYLSLSLFLFLPDCLVRWTYVNLLAEKMHNEHNGLYICQGLGVLTEKESRAMPLLA
jgi:hypothetical protein